MKGRKFAHPISLCGCLRKRLRLWYLTRYRQILSEAEVPIEAGEFTVHVDLIVL